MKSRIFTILTLILSLSGIIRADNAVDAADMYEKGDYAAALEKYLEIEKAYGTSSQLLFNIGQCYVKGGNLGEGMLAYRRALLLDPSDKRIKENIRYVESRVIEANKGEMKGKKLSATPEDTSFFQAIRNKINFSHTSNTWALWGAGFFIIFAGCLAAYLFSSEVLIRKIGFFGGISSLVMSVVFLIFALMAADALKKQDKGVIMAYKIELKSEPGQDEKRVGMPLTQGTVMDVLEKRTLEDSETRWYKVRLNSDYIGWINEENFSVI